MKKLLSHVIVLLQVSAVSIASITLASSTMAARVIISPEQPESVKLSCSKLIVISGELERRREEVNI